MMPSVSQLTLNLEPSLVDRWATLRKFIAHRVEVQSKPAKTIAAEMDLSPSALSKKLHPGETDTNRFNCDDLEAYLTVTGDVQSVIEYLATKYAPGGDGARRARTLSRLETLASTLQREIDNMRSAT